MGVEFCEDFPESTEMIKWFSFLKLVMWCITLIVDTEKYLLPWDKSHLVMVYDPFNVLYLVC